MCFCIFFYGDGVLSNIKEKKGRMKTKLLSKLLGVGLAIGLTFSLGAAFIASPAAQADEMEWGQVNTPSWEDMVILPASDILDYAVGEDEGDVVYAVLELESSSSTA